MHAWRTSRRKTIEDRYGHLTAHLLCWNRNTCVRAFAVARSIHVKLWAISRPRYCSSTIVPVCRFRQVYIECIPALETVYTYRGEYKCRQSKEMGKPP